MASFFFGPFAKTCQAFRSVSDEFAHIAKYLASHSIRFARAREFHPVSSCMSAFALG